MVHGTPYSSNFKRTKRIYIVTISETITMSTEEEQIAIAIAESLRARPAAVPPPPPSQVRTIVVNRSGRISETTLRDIVENSSESILAYVSQSLRALDAHSGRLEFQVRGAGISGEIRRFDEIEPIIIMVVESTAVVAPDPPPFVVEELPVARMARAISEPRYLTTDVALSPEVSQSLLRREDRFKTYISETYGISGYLTQENRSFFVASAAPEWFDVLQQWINALTPAVVEECFPCFKEAIDITSVAGLIIGKKGSTLEWLQRSYGVYCPPIRPKAAGDKTPVILHAEALDRTALDIFVHQIRQIVADRAPFMEELQDLHEKHVHIFVDISNILRGAQHMPDGSRDLSVRLNPHKTVELVRNLRSTTPDSNTVVGSNPPPNNPVWKKWVEAGVPFQHIPNAQGREHAVDDVIHAKIQDTILKFDSTAAKRTIAILTGDGNDNKGRTSFPGVVEAALRKGFSVEVWSWRAQCSKVYSKFQENYPRYFSLKYLDEHRSFVTFHSGGGAVIGGGAKGQLAAKVSEEDLLCPISMEPMYEAVRTPSGQVYDLKSITQWIHEKGIDPITRNPLNTAELIPDEALRALVLRHYPH